MQNRLLFCIGALLCVAICRPAMAQDQSGSAASTKVFIGKYCVSCHNEKLRTAELLLDQANVEALAQHPEIWEKVVKKLRAGQMPPAGAPRPDKAAVSTLADYLEAQLDAQAAKEPDPGRTAAVHRLNRIEYANAVRDLLHVEIDSAALLPRDDAGYGFDNIGDALSLSPLLLEKYMSAAGKISRMAVGDVRMKPVTTEYEPTKHLMQRSRMSEDLPFGSRGGMVVKHLFPVDGEYSIRIRMLRNHREYIVGLAEPHDLDVRLDGTRVKRFRVGGEHKGASGPLFASASKVGDTPQETYEHFADDGLEFRIAVKAGTRLLGATFQKLTTEPEGALLPPMTGFNKAQFKGGDPGIGAIIVNGPYNPTGFGDTPSRRAIFVCQPARAEDEEGCAVKILTRLSRLAFRRPVQNEDIQPLLKLYREGRQGGSFEEGIQAALQMILVSPQFLNRMEHDPASATPGKAYRITDLELASRLSFFLWSSLPDEELLQLAESKKLSDPKVLSQQVSRMMADNRSKALLDNFAGQWLYLRNIPLIEPDGEQFGEFDDNLREAFGKETSLFFESIVREDRSVVDLLNADFTFVNERLARHYGMRGIYGDQFRRVPVANDLRRGLLGQSSILTVTSYANRTSPVLRGKWVLEQLLGTPPPAPPPNVPALEDKKDKDGRSRSMRQQMEEHRANPVCASCHRVMDPLGFALENFDAIGQYHATAPGTETPIDVSGELPDGTKFSGATELRNILVGKREQFASTLTEKLLIYALGRGLTQTDAPAVRRIVRDASGDNYRWSSIIAGIVNSVPFQMRRARS